MRTYWTKTVSNKRSAELNTWMEKESKARASRKHTHSYNMSKIRIKKLSDNS